MNEYSKMFIGDLMAGGVKQNPLNNIVQQAGGIQNLAQAYRMPAYRQRLADANGDLTLTLGALGQENPDLMSQLLNQQHMLSQKQAAEQQAAEEKLKAEESSLMAGKEASSAFSSMYNNTKYIADRLHKGLDEKGNLIIDDVTLEGLNILNDSFDTYKNLQAEAAQGGGAGLKLLEGKVASPMEMLDNMLGDKSNAILNQLRTQGIYLQGQGAVGGRMNKDGEIDFTQLRGRQKDTATLAKEAQNQLGTNPEQAAQLKLNFIQNTMGDIWGEPDFRGIAEPKFTFTAEERDKILKANAKAEPTFADLAIVFGYRPRTVVRTISGLLTNSPKETDKELAANMKKFENIAYEIHGSTEPKNVLKVLRDYAPFRNEDGSTDYEGYKRYNNLVNKLKIDAKTTAELAAEGEKLLTGPDTKKQSDSKGGSNVSGIYSW